MLHVSGGAALQKKKGKGDFGKKNSSKFEISPIRCTNKCVALLHV